MPFIYTDDEVFGDLSDVVIVIVLRRAVGLFVDLSSDCICALITIGKGCNEGYSRCLDCLLKPL